MSVKHIDTRPVKAWQEPEVIEQHVHTLLLALSQLLRDSGFTLSSDATAGLRPREDNTFSTSFLVLTDGDMRSVSLVRRIISTIVRFRPHYDDKEPQASCNCGEEHDTNGHGGKRSGLGEFRSGSDGSRGKGSDIGDRDMPLWRTVITSTHTGASAGAAACLLAWRGAAGAVWVGAQEDAGEAGDAEDGVGVCVRLLVADEIFARGGRRGYVGELEDEDVDRMMDGKEGMDDTGDGGKAVNGGEEGTDKIAEREKGKAKQSAKQVKGGKGKKERTEEKRDLRAGSKRSGTLNSVKKVSFNSFGTNTATANGTAAGSASTMSQTNVTALPRNKKKLPHDSSAHVVREGPEWQLAQIDFSVTGEYELCVGQECGVCVEWEGECPVCLAEGRDSGKGDGGQEGIRSVAADSGRATGGVNGEGGVSQLTSAVGSGIEGHSPPVRIAREVVKGVHKSRNHLPGKGGQRSEVKREKRLRAVAHSAIDLPLLSREGAVKASPTPSSSSSSDSEDPISSSTASSASAASSVSRSPLPTALPAILPAPPPPPSAFPLPSFPTGALPPPPASLSPPSTQPFLTEGPLTPLSLLLSPPASPSSPALGTLSPHTAASPALLSPPISPSLPLQAAHPIPAPPRLFSPHASPRISPLRTHPAPSPHPPTQRETAEFSTTEHLSTDVPTKQRLFPQRISTQQSSPLPPLSSAVQASPLEPPSLFHRALTQTISHTTALRASLSSPNLPSSSPSLSSPHPSTTASPDLYPPSPPSSPPAPVARVLMSPTALSAAVAAAVAARQGRVQTGVVAGGYEGGGNRGGRAREGESVQGEVKMGTNAGARGTPWREGWQEGANNAVNALGWSVRAEAGLMEPVIPSEIPKCTLVVVDACSFYLNCCQAIAREEKWEEVCTIGNWVREVIRKTGIPRQYFPELVRPECEQPSWARMLCTMMMHFDENIPQNDNLLEILSITSDANGVSRKMNGNSDNLDDFSVNSSLFPSPIPPQPSNSISVTQTHSPHPLSLFYPPSSPSLLSSLSTLYSLSSVSTLPSASAHPPLSRTTLSPRAIVQAALPHLPLSPRSRNRAALLRRAREHVWGRLQGVARHPLLTALVVLEGERTTDGKKEKKKNSEESKEDGRSVEAVEAEGRIRGGEQKRARMQAREDEKSEGPRKGEKDDWSSGSSNGIAENDKSFTAEDLAEIKRLRKLFINDPSERFQAREWEKRRRGKMPVSVDSGWMLIQRAAEQLGWGARAVGMLELRMSEDASGGSGGSGGCESKDSSSSSATSTSTSRSTYPSSASSTKATSLPPASSAPISPSCSALSQLLATAGAFSPLLVLHVRGRGLWGCTDVHLRVSRQATTEMTDSQKDENSENSGEECSHGEDSRDGSVAYVRMSYRDFCVQAHKRLQKWRHVTHFHHPQRDLWGQGENSDGGSAAKGMNGDKSTHLRGKRANRFGQRVDVGVSTGKNVDDDMNNGVHGRLDGHLSVSVDGDDRRGGLNGDGGEDGEDNTCNVCGLSDLTLSDTCACEAVGARNFINTGFRVLQPPSSQRSCRLNPKDNDDRGSSDSDKVEEEWDAVEVKAWRVHANDPLAALCVCAGVLVAWNDMERVCDRTADALQQWGASVSGMFEEARNQDRHTPSPQPQSYTQTRAHTQPQPYISAGSSPISSATVPVPPVHAALPLKRKAPTQEQGLPVENEEEKQEKRTGMAGKQDEGGIGNGEVGTMASTSESIPMSASVPIPLPDAPPNSLPGPQQAQHAPLAPYISTPSPGTHRGLDPENAFPDVRPLYVSRAEHAKSLIDASALTAGDHGIASGRPGQAMGGRKGVCVAAQVMGNAPVAVTEADVGEEMRECAYGELWQRIKGEEGVEKQGVDMRDNDVGGRKNAVVILHSCLDTANGTHVTNNRTSSPTTTSAPQPSSRATAHGRGGMAETGECSAGVVERVESMLARVGARQRKSGRELIEELPRPLWWDGVWEALLRKI